MHKVDSRQLDECSLKRMECSVYDHDGDNYPEYIGRSRGGGRAGYGHVWLRSRSQFLDLLIYAQNITYKC